MNGDGRDAGELGRGIAAILRVGTIMAVLTISVGFIVASMTGLPSRGGRPLTDYLTIPGPDAPIAVGLFALTLLPMIAIAYAARVFARGGERHRLAMSLIVLALLGASLVVAAAVGRGELTAIVRSATLLAPEGEYPRTGAIVSTAEQAPPGGSGRPVSRSGETFGHSSQPPRRTPR